MNSEISAESTINRLKQLLAVKTDFDLAEIIGVSKPTISAWRQRNSVPHTICIQISQEKNVSLDWLLTGEGDTYKRTGLNPVSVTDKNGVVNVVNESEGANDSITPAKVELLKLLDRITEVDPAALQGFIYDAKKHIENCEMRNELAQMRQMISQQQMAA